MDGSPVLHEPFLNPLHSFGSGVGFVFGGVRLAAILQLKSAKVTSGDMAQKAFWGSLADVMGRYRHMTSAHHLSETPPGTIARRHFGGRGRSLDSLGDQPYENSVASGKYLYKKGPDSLSLFRAFVDACQ